MATRNHNQILLSGCADRFEYKAAGAIKPGYLIKVDSAGEVVVHATADGFAEVLFAVEDSFQGKTVDDAYADNDKVFAIRPKSGARIAARLKPDTAYVVGDQLVPAGDGSLTKVDSGSKQVIAILEEAFDLNDTGDVETLARVRIL
jgi:hypothetical protein